MIRSTRNRLRRQASRIETLEARIVLDAAATATAEYGPLDTFESDDQLREYLLDQHRESFESQTGRSFCYLPFNEIIPLRTAAAFDSASQFNLTAPSHSDTNVQVAGVDEADLVETDGQFIYSLSGDSLVIVNSWPVDDLRVMSRTQLSGRAEAMFLHGDRLTVIAAADLDGGETGFSITTLDITDRETPQLISTTAIEGTFETARLINGEVYVQSSTNYQFPRRETVEGTPEEGTPEVVEQDRIFFHHDCYGLPSGSQERFETWEEYVERVSATLVDGVLPDYQTLDSAGNVVAEGQLTSTVDVHAGHAEGGYGLITLTVLDVSRTDVGVDSSSAVFSGFENSLYANTDTIVLGSGYVPHSAGLVSTLEETNTGLYQIDITGEGDPVWTAAGSVPGRVLNQFSLDIHGDQLRVATTEQVDDWLTVGGKTNLFVLQQQNDQLQVTGSLEDFAPDEAIFSVRFMGEHAFAVTANQSRDPLFSFDLTDAADPQIVDHLEMPGMSSYLHAAGNGMLIGVGVDSLTVGQPQTPRLSLFNVSDLGELSVAEHEVFTVEAIEALYEQFDVPLPSARHGFFQFNTENHVFEHHAFSYDQESGLLTLPLTYSTFNAPRADLLVFQIETTAGTIEPRGIIQHAGQVERSVTIDGHIYSISQETLKVHDPAALDQAVAALNFRNDPIDVNHDGIVAISDMLTIVAELRMMQREGESLSTLRSALHRPELDVDSDGTLTVNDALFIAGSLRNRAVTGQFASRLPSLPSDSRNRIVFNVIEVAATTFIETFEMPVRVANDQAVLALLAENGSW